jgi:hypothetical protein
MHGVFNTLAFFYIEKFTNKKRRGNLTLHVVAWDVELDSGCGQPPPHPPVQQAGFDGNNSKHDAYLSVYKWQI